MKTTQFNFAMPLLLLILCGLAPAAAQMKGAQGADEQSLTALIKQAVNAQASFDASVLERIYASDYLEVSPLGEIDLREKAIGFYKPQAGGSSQPKAVVSADEFQTRSYGDVAVVVSRVTFSPDGITTPQRPPISFRATYVCRKEKGQWKISSVQVTGIRPMPKPQ
jgi:ketosteroid isomerase-like protein